MITMPHCGYEVLQWIKDKIETAARCRTGTSFLTILLFIIEYSNYPNDAPLVAGHFFAGLFSEHNFADDNMTTSDAENLMRRKWKRVVNCCNHEAQCERRTL